MDEWTADTVFALLMSQEDDHLAHEAVADAHNAALAAERHWLGELLAVIHGDGGHYQSEHGTEKATKDAIKIRTEMVLRIDELETQLAAERQKNDDWRNTERRVAKERDEARQQLAAEREKYDELQRSVMDLSHPNCKGLLDERNKAREQLAAEREKAIS